MIDAHRNFFSKLGFNVDKHLIHNEDIKEKIDENAYYYEAPKNANTSFYFLDSPNLEPDKKKEFHLRIWNENKADLYLLPESDHINIYYSRTNPKEEKEKISIDRFPLSRQDNELIKKINKWHFDTGTFWLEYRGLLEKIGKKKRTVNDELLETLKGLRRALNDEYKNAGIDEIARGDTVQALIDRTLFIKFLEDRQIINSFFYKHFFGSPSVTYKDFLKEKNRDKVNRLFTQLNEIFRSTLFEDPNIPEFHLTDGVLEALCLAIGRYDFETRQLSLFDFRFDIIPIEFIGHIYEIFLEKKQAKEGIYYTPEGLAKFIVESVIGKDIGKTIDPSCGSGVFLVMAFRRLLENADIKDDPTLDKIIDERAKLLVDNIFGIEKANIARRLTVFSLYLELLNGIKPGEIKALIKERIETTGECKLFRYNFDGNIKTANALETDDEKKPFKDKQFDFIVGNPPWKEIKETDEENKFWKQHKEHISGKQLSQCFLVKVEEWVKPGTRCGFVVNSSNFYNEQTTYFPHYFFSKYNIESFYDLSKLKSLLFRTSKESTSVVIFSNSDNTDNKVAYFTAEMNDFTKIFGNIFIKSDDIVYIPQNELISGELRLRDYLIGNNEDVDFLKELSGSKYRKLEDYLLEKKAGKYFIHEGLTFVSSKAVCKYLGIEKNTWDGLTKPKQDDYKQKFVQKYSGKQKSEGFTIPYIKPENISKYKITSVDCYMGHDRSAFERRRDDEVFSGEKLLCARVGGEMKAVYTKEPLYFSSDIYVIKLKDKKFYYFVQAVLNSRLVEYFLTMKARKRVSDSFPKITKSDLKKIPLPKHPDENIVKEIDALSKKLFSTEEQNPALEKELENCIYKLYGLNVIQKNRIDDFFIGKQDHVTESDMKEYCLTFFKIFKNVLKNNIRVDFGFFIEESLPVALCGVAIHFSKSGTKEEHAGPGIRKVVRFFEAEGLRKMSDFSIISPKEKLYGEDCIYIIKDKYLRNWSVTKAVEDAREEIRRLVAK